MKTERESIDEIQAKIADIKKCAKAEIKKAEKAGDGVLTNAWSKAFHTTGLYHAAMTDLLIENYEDFSDEVVTRGGGGR